MNENGQGACASVHDRRAKARGRTDDVENDDAFRAGSSHCHQHISDSRRMRESVQALPRQQGKARILREGVRGHDPITLRRDRQARARGRKMMIKMGVLAALMVMITVSTSQDARACSEDPCERRCAPYINDINVYNECILLCNTIGGKHTE